MASCPPRAARCGFPGKIEYLQYAREPAIGRPAGPAVPLMAPRLPSGRAGDALYWAWGACGRSAGCSAPAGEGKLPAAFAGCRLFAAAAVLICGFAAGTSAGGLARWYMKRRSAAGGAVLALGRAARQYTGRRQCWRCCSSAPLHAAHKMLLQPLRDRAAKARTVRKSRKTAKSRKTQNSAEKQFESRR